jgi:hypothetical protein
MKYKKDYVKKNLLDEFDKDDSVAPLALVKSESV